jgi:hypothetical protein
LRASEERFRTLFELGPSAVYACHARGVIQDFNQRATELWGRTPARSDDSERFCGSIRMFRPDGSFMYHERCPMAWVVSGKVSEVNDEEVIVERPDGSRVTAVVNIRSLRNERGEITGAITGTGSFSRKPNIGQHHFRRSFTDLRSIVIYSELKHFWTIEMKSNNEKCKSKQKDSVSNLRLPPIASFGGNCM